jgi:hypothetical protein
MLRQSNWCLLIPHKTTSLFHLLITGKKGTASLWRNAMIISINTCYVDLIARVRSADISNRSTGEERGNVAKFCNCTSGGRAADRNWSSSPVGSYCRRKLMAKRSTLNGTKDGGESFNSGTWLSKIVNKWRLNIRTNKFNNTVFYN